MNITARLTKDAEVRTLSNGKQMVNFSVAVNDSYQNKQGERVNQATYFDCSYWRTPNVAKILTKGALVELSARAWIGKDQQAHAGLNFHTSQIKLHGAGKRAETTQATAQVVNNVITSETTDDLPF